MSSQATRFDIQTVEDCTVACFLDSRILDEATIQVVGDQMYRLVDSGLVKIILDFSNVEHLSSAALGKLINMKNGMGYNTQIRVIWRMQYTASPNCTRKRYHELNS